MFLVLGLGNPGPKYVATRHNVGFLVVDALARQAMATVGKAQQGALVAKVRLGPESVVLAKPQSYMNRSGGPGQQLQRFYKVAPERVVVVHDELDLPFGQVRIKRGGGHGGHNGLRDLKQRLGTGDFLRVRVGISRPPPGWEVSNYVLGRWSDDESAALSDVVRSAGEAVEAIVREGDTAAMNRFNVRPGKGRGAGASNSGAAGSSSVPVDPNPMRSPT